MFDWFLSKKKAKNPAAPAATVDDLLKQAISMLDAGRFSDLLEICTRIIELEPSTAAAHKYSAIALHELGRRTEAEHSFRQVIQLNPSQAEGHYNLGRALNEQGRREEAIASYREAIALDPGLTEAYNNLGAVYTDSGELNSAAECFQKALSLNPGNADSHNNLGNVYRLQGKLEQAVGCFRRAVELRPDFHSCRAALVFQLQQLCMWEDLSTNAAFLRKVIREARHGEHVGIAPFSLLALPGATTHELKLCAQHWAHGIFKPQTGVQKARRFRSARPADGKIRIGYLSWDFHDHATARLMAEVFSLHDRNAFHISAYSYGPEDGSAMRARLKASFDSFVDISNASFDEAAERIHADGIDILVDLKGYTLHTRSAILALRPAPIQVNYLGFPGTMGTEYVDYLIADKTIIPPELASHYTEKVVWLPDCYQPNDRSRPRPAPPSRSSIGLPEESVVFCCFNQSYKITPEIFGLWCRLLNEVPGSVLWLLVTAPQVEANLKKEAAKRGIDPNRLVAAPPLKQEEHLARLQCADLFLDTVPVNAHTTCSDALWMGLPVVTVYGETFASRVAASLLTAMDLPELVAKSLEDYHRIALSLATDREKRMALRAKIASIRDCAPLFDSERLTRNLEKSYLEIFNAYLSCRASA